MAGLCLGLLGPLVTGCTDTTDPPARPGAALPTGATGATSEAPARVTADAVRSLADLERALRRGRPDLLARPAARGPGVAPRLRAAVENAAALGIRDVDLRHVGPVVGSSATGNARSAAAWSVPVELSWRLADYDARPSTVRLVAGLAASGSAVRVVSLISAPGGTRPIWLSGPVRTRTSERTLVLAARGQPIADHARRARRAVEVVSAVLPRWRGPLVVEVPRDQRALERAMGASGGSYAGIAAVTAEVGDGVRRAAPVHVLVNPDVLGRLGPRGAQVVLSHEATHVATGGLRADSSPGWLREGFADYVALRDVDLPLQVTAAQVIDQVRRDGPPARLPGGAALAADAPALGAAYEAAWLACRVVVARGGEAALVGLRRDVARGASLEAALQAWTGWRRADLRAAWRARLRAVAEPSPAGGLLAVRPGRG